jgi:uncharacterized membrane protein
MANRNVDTLNWSYPKLSDAATAPQSRWQGHASLTWAVRTWFVVAVAGQWMFAYYIAAFYGASALRGNWARWNEVLPHGYVPGNTVGNAALTVHLFFASAISFMGAVQLVPQIRARFPTLHRWLGRTYLPIAFTMGISALYLALSGRKVVGDLPQHIAVIGNAFLILLCAALAWRYALARDFQTHRRWALRLFLVVNGVWFFRVELMCWLAINQHPVGFDPDKFTGPFLTLAGFAQTLLPLTMLEIYMRVVKQGTALSRFATAAAIAVLTVAMGTGIGAATMGMWLPVL